MKAKLVGIIIAMLSVLLLAAEQTAAASTAASKAVPLGVSQATSQALSQGTPQAPTLQKADANLPALLNWADVATAAQKAKVPIIVMVSLEGCGFCKTVRQSHLQPLHELEKSTPRAIVRQIELNGAQTFVDANGLLTTHAKYAQKLGAKVAPTMFFLDAKGEQIASPIEGGLIPDFYGAYLDDAIDTATNKIRSSDKK